MTLEDIFQIGEAAHKAVMKSPGGGLEKADRARTKAIVEALRDELRREWFLDDSGLDAVERWMNEILASDGVDKAAGGSTRKTEHGDGTTGATSAVAATTPAANLAELVEEALRKPVPYRPGFPAAAPDVCVWTLSPVALGFCSAGCQPHNAFVRPIDNCHLCGKPISFKEAAR